MANSVKRIAAALALAAGAGALTGCGTVPGAQNAYDGARNMIGGILPNSGATAPVQTTAGVSASALPPGTYLDPRGYQRYNDSGAVVGAPAGSCQVMQRAAAAANRPNTSDLIAGRQIAGGLGNATGGGLNAIIQGAVNGNPRTLQRAATVASNGVAQAARGAVTGTVNGMVNGNAQGNAAATYQVAYQSCGQEFAAKVDAMCAPRSAGDRNAPVYAQCFERGIANSPAPPRR